MTLDSSMLYIFICRNLGRLRDPLGGVHGLLGGGLGGDVPEGAGQS